MLLTAAVAAAIALVVQLFRQQGRMLLRLERLEQRLDALGAPEGEVDPDALPVGTSLPPFALPDLDGRTVRLDDYRGRRLLLVNWDFGCAYCRQIAPDLAEFRATLRDRGTELVLASSGDAATNRRRAQEHALDFPILLQSPERHVETFHDLGTPAAYLVDEEGRVARPLAYGADEVPALVREAAREREGTNDNRDNPLLRRLRPLSESRILRSGLEAGTAAPAFQLPGVDGRTVSLADYRGRRVLLVFSAPDCAPCDALAPTLARLDREVRHDGLAIVMVSRGTPEENRRKADEYGVEFPVLIQPGWRISRAYGTFTTPVAFAIGPDGVLESGVAEGEDQILSLARTARARGTAAALDAR